MNFKNFDKLNFLYQAGKDNLGRPIIVLLGKLLPETINMEHVLLYIINYMDPIVEGRYTFSTFFQKKF
jgi:hypothetical protein